MDITDIENQSLSSILLDFNMCQKCKTVDRRMEREFVGYECPDCGTPSEGGVTHFSLSVMTLVDLIQDYYHLTKETTNQQSASESGSKKTYLAVIVFFCTLGEVLLEDFLRINMKTHEIPNGVQKRLLDDNLFSKQRIDKLFPLFTGDSWNKAIQELDKEAEINYKETIEFYLEVVEKRNKVLHKGYAWNVPPDMPEKCLKNLWPLISLFVALHNKFVRSV